MIKCEAVFTNYLPGLIYWLDHSLSCNTSESKCYFCLLKLSNSFKVQFNSSVSLSPEETCRIVNETDTDTQPVIDLMPSESPFPKPSCLKSNPKTNSYPWSTQFLVASTSSNKSTLTHSHMPVTVSGFVCRGDKRLSAGQGSACGWEQRLQIISWRSLLEYETLSMTWPGWKSK